MLSHSAGRTRGITAAAVLVALVLLAVGTRPALRAQAPAAARATHTFGWQGERFLLDGRPMVILSGEMHYPRVPRAYWRDRMRKMKAMGLNTLCTYVFWNLHEPRPGKFDFGGNLDVAAFVRTAQEEGLWVIVRPGPYICTEWDFGGLPSWLLAPPGTTVRTTDPRFLKAAASYMQRVGRELAPLQVTRGGPIIMAQVENEYGSFGSDKTYLGAIRDLMVQAGFDVPLYTSDGPEAPLLSGGTLPGVLSVVNFEAGVPDKYFDAFASFRQNVPRMCGEYWVGWFDHWGEVHNHVPAARAAEGLEWMLARDISVNLYMFHGGTSFGFMAGANEGKAYEPDISSYDYDSPLDEAGRPTEKFHALRAVIERHLPPGTTLPPLPAPLPIIGVPRFTLTRFAGLLQQAGQSTRHADPESMEALGPSYGFVLYRTQIDQALNGPLRVAGANDYLLAFQGGRLLGVMDRRLKQDTIDVSLRAGEPLDLLVEHMGRVNFGSRLGKSSTGLVGPVTVAGRVLSNWQQFPIPLDAPAELAYADGAGPGFYRGTFDVPSRGDTFLDLRGWGKGYVWVNGHNLGRYWKIGPQQTLFVPAVWLAAGRNDIIVLDLEPGAARRSIQGLTGPVWETPGAAGARPAGQLVP